MEPEIIVTHIANSSLAGQEQRFPKPLVTVGRDSNTDIDFDPDEDLVVSHHHAELYVEDDRLLIRDMGSRNGTYVNQRRITDPVELQPEDAIHFGFGGPLAKAQLARPEELASAKHTLLAAVFPGLKPKPLAAMPQQKPAADRPLPIRAAPAMENAPAGRLETPILPPLVTSPTPSEADQLVAGCVDRRAVADFWAGRSGRLSLPPVGAERDGDAEFFEHAGRRTTGDGHCGARTPGTRRRRPDDRRAGGCDDQGVVGRGGRRRDVRRSAGSPVDLRRAESGAGCGDDGRR